jgi:hypothetical protein
MRPPTSLNPDHGSGHVPVGQDEPLEDEPPDLAAKVENSFCVSFAPHSSHLWGLSVPAFSRNEVTWPHFLHLYSKIGICFFSQA